MKNIAFITARAGSKRLKNKNFNHLFIEYLIYYLKKKTIRSKIFDKFPPPTVCERLKKYLKSLVLKFSFLDQRNILMIDLQKGLL